MISTAAYARIDPGVPAAFSPRIVTGLLRGRLGFRGVVISDDLGQAAQVADVSIGQRAVRFVQAGGDIVLTVNATQAAAMTSALLARAKRDPAFRQLVDFAALRVLREKAALGLLV
jgi:beta-N-acetylhexosaminidase